MKELELNVDMRQMILAIETAVSLVGMNDTNHGKRVAHIASQIGHALDFVEDDLNYVFELGLLHDCGVSTYQMHANLVNYFDWNDAHIHCEIGYRLLKNFEPLAKFAVPILHHHTHWKELRDLPVSRRDARMANLIFLSDRIAARSAQHCQTDILLAREKIVDAVAKSNSGTLFDPELVDALMHAQSSEAFWIALEDRHILRRTWDMGQIETPQRISLDHLRQLSMILAYIVDQKSPFTARHSVGVADLAKYLASTYGLSESRCLKVEIAGLLHDLGKLHTPDRILDKAGPLDDTERSIMNQHSFETFEILRHIRGLGEIAQWAAYHHEGVRGGGYPFHPQQRDLSVEARLIAVADVFQALVQDRPYRKGLPLDAVIAELDRQARSGRLDEGLVEMAKEHRERCLSIAKGSDDLSSTDYIRMLTSAYPAILKKNEEVLRTDDPRNILNGGLSDQAAAPTVQSNLKIMNMVDSASVVCEGLSTQEGERAIINVIRSNRTAIKSIVD